MILKLDRKPAPKPEPGVIVGYGIVYHTNSSSPRAQRWYHISRVAFIDNRWWEVYWLDQRSYKSLNAARDWAISENYSIMKGTFTSPTERPHPAGELTYSQDNK